MRYKMSKIAIFLVLMIFCNGLLCALPKRENGVSAHFAPGREPGIFGAEKSGFVISVGGKNKPASERPFMATPKELVEFILEQSEMVKENGLWLVTTNPSAYSDQEMENTEILKKLCDEKRIMLFFCRGKFLPSGWIGADEFILKDSDKIYGRISTARKLENQAIKHAKAGDLDKSVDYFSRAIEIAPHPDLLLQKRGTLFLTKKDFAKAIEDFTRAMEINSSDKTFVARCCNDRAVAYFQAGQFEKSWKDAQKSIELGLNIHPGFMAALKSKGFGK